MKALVLFSGGLDSILAAGILKGLKVEVEALHFETPFTGRTRGRTGGISAEESALRAGVAYRKVYAGDEYLRLLENPDFGYGKNINPCIDCKIFFIRKAGELMSGSGASFIATGEVLGQRPMSQNKQALELIAKKSGFADLLLRPLSAKLLPPTLPEREGWVDREKLFGFSGRGRSGQIELAGELGISSYPAPGGGCLLTYSEFSEKISDLVAHKALSAENVELLKFGRHFRIGPGFKLAAGRDEEDNAALEKMAGYADYLFRTVNCAGPVGLGIGKLTPETARISCGIIARYASHGAGEVEIKISGKQEITTRTEKMTEAEADKYRIQDRSRAVSRDCGLRQPGRYP